MKKAVFALLQVSMLATFALAGAGQTPTIEQSLNLKSAAGPRISPDGRYVAYHEWFSRWIWGEKACAGLEGLSGISERITHPGFGKPFEP